MKQTNIVATVFGGSGDAQPSAYADVAPGWPERPGVALPYHFAGVRPRVVVSTSKASVVCDIVDVGPWNTNDAYWQNDTRPQAMSGTDTHGRHTNLAGIDLTPAAAKALGVNGKGLVDWDFAMAIPHPTATPAKSLWSVLLDFILSFFKPSAPSAPTTPVGVAWMGQAERRIGFHEKPNNTGLEQLIAEAHTGSEGDPWCAIFVNACLETAGVHGSRSPAARSFEHDANFVKLSGPALGAVVTNWRGSPSSGLGHVYFYAGEDSRGILALGGNQSDQVMYQFEPRDRVVGYWWPTSQPLPKVGSISPINTTAKGGGSES